MDPRQKHAGMTGFINALSQIEGFYVGDQKICNKGLLLSKYNYANFLEHQQLLEIQ